MIIYKCDRCGKEENINTVYPYIFGDEGHKPKFFITKNEESSVKMIHLCPNCEEKLDEFLNIEDSKRS